MSTIKIFNRKLKVPQQKWLRILLGISLIIGGVLGFLPIVGFWMLPLGIVVLSMDIPIVRRLKRKIALKWARRRQTKSR